MKKSAYLEIREFILRALLDDRCYSQKQHTLSTITKWVGREFDNDRKLAKQVTLKLIAQGLLKGKSKHYDMHVWLNADRLDEIKAILLEKPTQ